MRMPRRLLVPVIALAAAAAVAVPAVAGTGPVPRLAGVHTVQRPVCYPYWVADDTGRGAYVNYYAAPGVCVNVSGWRDQAWSVTSTGTSRAWRYPNESYGTEWTRYTCDDAPSAYGPGSHCQTYPVQVRHDGYPVASASWYRPPTVGNVSWDIWFNKTYVAPVNTRQDNGAEIMIWLDDSRVHTVPSWYFTYAGIRWAVESWRAGPRNGVTWNYVAYVATRTVHSAGLWLNHFFRDAQAHGKLSPDWWETGADFGPEIAPGGMADGFTVTRYSLVRAA